MEKIYNRDTAVETFSGKCFSKDKEQPEILILSRVILINN